jgi:hypothetical protein
MTNTCMWGPRDVTPLLYKWNQLKALCYGVTDNAILLQDTRRILRQGSQTIRKSRFDINGHYRQSLAFPFKRTGRQIARHLRDCAWWVRNLETVQACCDIHRIATPGGAEDRYEDVRAFLLALQRDTQRLRAGEWELVFSGPMTAYEETNKLDYPVYAHVSQTDPEKVAFHASRGTFLRDIQTTTTPGRFLKKHFPHWSDDQVRIVAEAYLAIHGAAALRVSRAMDDFIRVVHDTPGSCMGEPLEYAGHIHPAAVYASGDMEVLWIEDRTGGVTARTLANAATKEYTRIYGDASRMRAALRQAGYAPKKHALVGCRLLRMENEEGPGYIMPYVDAGTDDDPAASLCYKADDDPAYWVLSATSGESTYCGYTFDGLTTETFTCDKCGRQCEELHDVAGVDLCDACLNRSYVYSGHHDEYLRRDAASVCADCGDAFRDGEVTATHSGEYVCSACLREYALAWVNSGEMEYVPVGHALYCAPTDDWYWDVWVDNPDCPVEITDAGLALKPARELKEKAA